MLVGNPVPSKLQAQTKLRVGEDSVVFPVQEIVWYGLTICGANQVDAFNSWDRVVFGSKNISIQRGKIQNERVYARFRKLSELSMGKSRTPKMERNQRQASKFK